MNVVHRYHIQFIHYCAACAHAAQCLFPSSSQIARAKVAPYSIVSSQWHKLHWSCLGNVGLRCSFISAVLFGEQRIVSTSFSLAPGRVHLSRAVLYVHRLCSFLSLVSPVLLTGLCTTSSMI